ncbi:MAG: hypothetical protein LWX56_08185 [Ignavibacteria bacterium]|nr:hypothetical protein [Ignavibacteria bacterium]
MRKINILLGMVTAFVFISGSLFAQEKPMTDYEKVQAIYNSLEYNTLAFNDLKQKWVISDPLLVREVYNRFVVRDALRHGGNKMTLAQVKERTESIYNGSVVIDLRKRYYDDEIEYFAFVPEDQLQAENPNFLADPVKDPFLLQDIIGAKLYEKIRTQGYFYSNLTKSVYDTKNGYFYDVYLNALEPHVMYWNTTSSGRNKYLLSLFGKWGEDQLTLPGWYSGEYIVGTALTYYQSITSDPSKYLYDFRAGIAVKSGRPFLSDFKGRQILQPTGQAAYFRASGDVLKYIISGAEGYYLNVEFKYTVNVYSAKEFKPEFQDTISSVRNFGIVEIRKKDIASLGDFGNLEVGGGIATSDYYRYLISPTSSKLTDIDSKKGFVSKFRHNVFVEAGLSRTGGLIQHQVNFQLSYDTEGFSSFGVMGKVMLSDQLGLDLRVMQGFGLDTPTKRWRPDTYIVFSPILRINY